VYGIAKNLTTELVYCMALCDVLLRWRKSDLQDRQWGNKRGVGFGFKVTVLESRLEFALLTNGKQ
jgi:ubiquinone biosynthesis protein COQ9